MAEDDNAQKHCYICGEIKPLDMFPRHIRLKKIAYCKLCEGKALGRKADIKHAHEKGYVGTNPNILQEIKLAEREALARAIQESISVNAQIVEPPPISRSEVIDTGIADTRECARCGGKKPLKMFIQDPKRKSGWHPFCLDCKAAHIARNRARSESRRRRRAEERSETQIFANELLQREPKRFSKANVNAEEKARIQELRLWSEYQYALNRLDTGPYTEQDIEDLLKAQNYRCAYCKRAVDLTIDHIFPRSRGGGDEISNMCWACGKCNSSKRDKTPDEWIDRWYLRDKKSLGTAQ